MYHNVYAGIYSIRHIIYYHMSSYFVGGGAADRLSGLEWRYIKELFESAAGKVQWTSMSFSWNLYRFSKKLLQNRLGVGFVLRKSERVVRVAWENFHVFTSCCFLQLEKNQVKYSWPEIAFLAFTQSSQSTNLLNACCPVIIRCVCWIQVRSSTIAFN